MKLILLVFYINQIVYIPNLVAQEKKPGAATSAKVKYRESGRIDFESLLIEGEREKPEMSVVTGNLGEKNNGLLIFRKDFNDIMAADFGENIQ